MAIGAMAGERYNFNADWKLKVGYDRKAFGMNCDDSKWQNVTLPYAFNTHEAFGKAIESHTDTIMWYRKTFRLPQNMRGSKYFIEFEGVRQAARVFVNGKNVGRHENGVMAFGFDITSYLNPDADNIIAVEVDNSWRYREKESRSAFQWNNKNFNANYGGICKNVWFHVTGDVYQTLPLYSNLGTVGTYVYASNYDISAKTATVNVESQVRNGSSDDCDVLLTVDITDSDGKPVATFEGTPVHVKQGETVVCRASQNVKHLKFWSWGFGYLYNVTSRLMVDGKIKDCQTIRTGFRKTEFADGKIRLNDRTIQLKGFAQRSTNEWPAVGVCHPAWMSDYSNRLVLGCNGNLFRWMHVTPSKQDIESFDRLGLIQAMPAGDAEKDIEGRRWEQRLELMREAIIYNRNNPSILFYEAGNAPISEEHMLQMVALKNQYDPHGGRAMGCRNMNSSKIAEYGGEMLYINTSAGKPMWQMEYCRDEGIRRYWDRWSYPYHIEGDGPLFRGSRAVSYNHNQDGLAIENVIRWNEYWRARPGSGKRVNSGGAKIIFSDTNTHYRGEKNYRTSGDVDAMRIAKDSYFAHRVMWDGWVDTERHHTYIIGHWNYCDTVVKPVYVVSTGEEVELILNGRSLGKGKRSETFLFTFDNVKWQKGVLTAVSRNGKGEELSRYEIHTVGKAKNLRMRWIEAPENFRADGADIRIAEIEAVDAAGERCPLAHDMLTFSTTGPVQWLGGISGDVADSIDNRILSRQLALEAGVCRVMVRSTTEAGEVTLTAKAKGFKTAKINCVTTTTPVVGGFYVDDSGKAIEADWSASLPEYLERGETPVGESYHERFSTIAICGFNAACDSTNFSNLDDDDELSKWETDGLIQNAWLTVKLERKAKVDHIVIRMNNFRSTSYPLQITDATGKVVYEGYTPKTLGYCYLPLSMDAPSDTFTIRMIGPATVKEAFGDMTELAAKKTVSRKASKSNRLSIFEIAFNESIE